MTSRGIAAVVALALGAVPFGAPSQVQDCASSSAPALRFPESRDRISLLQAPVTGCGKSLEAVFVRISLRDARLALAVQTDPERGTRSVADYFQSVPQALAVVSGGFIQSFYPPLPAGFVKSGGRVLNTGRRTAILDGMLCIRGGRQVLIGPMSPAQAATYPDCLQSGPLLVVAGRPVIDFQHRKLPAGFLAPTRRAFVALLPREVVVMGMIENATLDDVVDVVARPVDRGGLGAIAAINLSGAASAGIAVSGGLAFGNVDVLLPNAIAARR